MRHSIREILIELRKQKGNCSKTARKLGIHKSTVGRWKKRSSKGGRFFINQMKRESTRPTNIKYVLTEQEKIKVEKKKAYSREFAFTRMLHCAYCESGITAEEKIKNSKTVGQMPVCTTDAQK